MNLQAFNKPASPKPSIEPDLKRPKARAKIKPKSTMSEIDNLQDKKFDVDNLLVLGFLEELKANLKLVRSLRGEITNDDGTIAEEFSIKDVRDVLSSATTLFTLLSKIGPKLENYDRLQAIEKATIDTIKTLDKDIQDKFFFVLNKKLENII